MGIWISLIIINKYFIYIVIFLINKKKGIKIFFNLYSLRLLVLY